MFHLRRDASKVALMFLVQLMRETGMTLLDVQWRTDHLESLGAVDVDRERYLALLAEAVATSGDVSAHASEATAPGGRNTSRVSGSSARAHQGPHTSDCQSGCDLRVSSA